MCWLVGEFEGRAGLNSVECFDNMDQSYGPGVRQMLEDEGIIVHLRDGKAATVIVRRDPEVVKWDDGIGKETDTDIDPEDALAHTNEQSCTAPKVPYDKVRWVEERSVWITLPENEYGEVERVRDWTQPTVLVEASAPVFPRLRDKRARGLCAILLRTVEEGITGRELARNLKACEKSLRRDEIARIWECWKLKRYLDTHKVERYADGFRPEDGGQED